MARARSPWQQLKPERRLIAATIRASHQLKPGPALSPQQSRGPLQLIKWGARLQVYLWFSDSQLLQHLVQKMKMITVD